MRKKILSIGFLLTFGIFSNAVSAQTGLTFDGVNDHVLSSAAAIQANGSRTLEAWIKCNYNSQQVFIVDMGVLGASSNGARFGMKINPGSNYLRVEIGGGGITGNTFITNGIWHHVAVVYDNDAASNKYKLYVDGVLDTQGDFTFPLNTTTTNEIKIGVRNDVGTGYFKGSIDEVRIWNVARTQAEIQANMAVEVCPQAGLLANYRFNEGVALGDNTSTLAVSDFSGNNYEGSLENFAMTGTLSNFISGASVVSAIDLSIENEGNVLTVGEIPGSNITYQWYDCSGATAVAIPGVTTQTYTATEAGSYSVEVTKNGCTEMSECKVVADLSASDFEKNIFKIYPNPATNQVTIQMGNFENAEITLTNITGQQILKKSINNTNQTTLDLDQPAGIYFVTVTTSSGNSQVMKFVKQ